MAVPLAQYPTRRVVCIARTGEGRDRTLSDGREQAAEPDPVEKALSRTMKDPG
jgi:hypothetical protein